MTRISLGFTIEILNEHITFLPFFCSMQAIKVTNTLQANAVLAVDIEMT